VHSDIDLMLVTLDDAKVQAGDVALNADGVNVHALLLPRAESRMTAEGAIRSSLVHSFLGDRQPGRNADFREIRLCQRIVTPVSATCPDSPPPIA